MTTRGEAAESDDADVSTFRVVAVAALAPGEAHRTGPRTEPTATLVTSANFGEVMSAITSSFVVDVEDPFDANAAPLRVDIRLQDLKSLRPDGLVDAAAPLRALAEARRLIGEAPRAGRNDTELRAHLARVLPRPEWAQQLLAGVNAAAASPASTVAAPLGSAPREPTGIDSILDMVDAGGPPRPTPASSAGPSTSPTRTERNDPIAALVSAVAKSARPPAPAGPRVAAGASTTANAAIARLIGSLIAHPEVRRLERLWRSVKLVVDHAPSRSGVEVYVIAAAGEEVPATLDALVESDAGGFDVVVLGEVLTATAVDLAFVRHAASVGEAINAPVLISGSSELLGAKDLASLGKSSRKLSTVDDPRAVAARAAASEDSMRWLFVALNGPLVRAPWDHETSRLRGLSFAQDASDPHNWIAALPAFALAALSAKSFASTGWPTPVTAPNAMLENLVVREVHDGGTTAALCVEAWVSDDAARELAQAGFVSFAGLPNRDSAYLRHAPCFYRPKGPVAKPAEGSLADALFVGSLVRALRELTDAIPAGTPPAKIGQVAEVIVRDLLSMAAPPGPEIETRVLDGQLRLVVRPHRFGGVTLEEIALEVPLHEGTD